MIALYLIAFLFLVHEINVCRREICDEYERAVLRQERLDRLYGRGK